MIECSNYKGINWLKNIYTRIPVDRFRKVTKGLIDDEQGGLEQ